jgi:hypothetical protein
VGEERAFASGTMNGYEQEWRDYRQIRNTFLVLFVSYVPVCFTFGFVSVRLFNTVMPAFVVAALWMVLLAFNGVRLNAWRCPNCGEWFSGTWWYNWGFLARRCVHCGLPKYANNPPANASLR